MVRCTASVLCHGPDFNGSNFERVDCVRHVMEYWIQGVHKGVATRKVDS